MTDIQIYPVLRAGVVVVGAGISGAWTALKLAQTGVKTILLTYKKDDRGGVSGSSIRSVGAINTSSLTDPNFAQYLDDLGLRQGNPAAAEIIQENLSAEIVKLGQFGKFKNIKLGVALSEGNAGTLIETILKRFMDLGGEVVDGWMTRVVSRHSEFVGVQYQSGNSVGKILASNLVIATGGYSGLFDGSVNNNNYGTGIGRFMLAGGLVTNVEFVFKHGYGKPDLGALTPTEELPGALVYDQNNVHVEWLERELYEGRGSANHMEAFKQWRSNDDSNYFISKQYQPLRTLLRSLRRLPEGDGAVNAFESFSRCVDQALPEFHEQSREQVRTALVEWFKQDFAAEFDLFKWLIPHYPPCANEEVFRVRQISYFSMGGIANIDCATNIRNVFVIGEAMHDFGAHRVGGLPWALYISCAEKLANTLREKEMGVTSLNHLADFPLIEKLSHFDQEMLEAVRVGLFKNHEREFNFTKAANFVAWLRNERAALLDAGRELDDAVSWLVLAEAIMQCSLVREESRGCFYRSDFPQLNEQMGGNYSCGSYSARSNSVSARLISCEEYGELCNHEFATA